MLERCFEGLLIERLGAFHVLHVNLKPSDGVAIFTHNLSFAATTLRGCVQARSPVPAFRVRHDFPFIRGLASVSTFPMRLPILALALVQLVAFASAKEVTIPAGKEPGLKLNIPEDAKATTKDTKTSVLLKETWVYFWSVPTAKTVAEAVPQAAKIIKSEFTDFEPAKSAHLTVAGNDAIHIYGKGAEADDGDPGAAEVVIFTVGKHVFVASVHGEKNEAADRSPHMMTLLKTVKAP
jgi:hypothetical protein